MPQDIFVRNARRAALLIYMLAAVVGLAWAQQAPDKYYRRVADSAFAMLAGYEYLMSEKAREEDRKGVPGERTVWPGQLSDSCALKLIPESIKRENHVSVGFSEIGNLRRQSRPPIVRVFTIKMGCLLHPMGEGKIVEDAEGGLFLVPSFDLQIDLFPATIRQLGFRLGLWNNRTVSLEPELFARLAVNFLEDVSKRTFSDDEVGLALQHLAYRSGRQGNVELLGTTIPMHFFLFAAVVLLFVLTFWMFLSAMRIDGRERGETWLMLDVMGRIERAAAVGLGLGLFACWAMIALYWMTENAGYDSLLGLSHGVWNGSDMKDVPALLVLRVILAPIALLTSGALMSAILFRLRMLSGKAREDGH